MDALDFVALDVETADSSFPESICQMGFAVVRNGVVVEAFTKTVYTPHKFGWWQKTNLTVSEDDVGRAPSFAEVAAAVAPLLAGPVFSHTSYDRNAIERACAVCGHSFTSTIWLDSAQVVRRAWPQKYGKSGYGLQNLASDFGIDFKHHDAGEDARAVAEIIIRACSEHSLSIADWIERVGKPIFGTNPDGEAASRDRRDLRRTGNADGPLHGEVVVLTGGFELSRTEQANLAAQAGCEVANSITKKTTLVVVGDRRFARGERSSKWRKAEQLAEQGLPVRVISESDFRALVGD